MKRIYLITFLILSLFSNAQNLELEKLESKKITKKSTLLFSQQDKNGDIFVLRRISKANSKYLVERYSKELKLLDQHEIDIRKNDIIDLRIIGETIALIQIEYNSRNKSYDLSKLSSSKISFNFKTELIYSVDRKKLQKHEKFGEYEKPELLIYDPIHLKPYGTYSFSEQNKAGVFVFFLKGSNYRIVHLNKLLNLETSYLIEGTKERASSYQDVTFNSKGDILFLEKNYNNSVKNDYRKGKVDYSLKLHKFFANKNKEVLELKVDKNLHKAKIVLNEENLSIVGLFYNGGDTFLSSAKTKGVYRANISEQIFTFQEDFYHSFSNKLNNEKAGPILIGYDGFRSPNIKNAYFKENGTLIIFAEEAYMMVDDGKEFYTNDNIIILEMNSDGGYKDLVINKRQSDHSLFIGSMSMRYFSYSALIKEGLSFFVFNAHENPKKDSSNNKFEFKKSSIAKSSIFLLSVNDEYKVNVQRFSKNVVLEFKNIIFLDESSFIVQGISTDKKTNLYKVTLI